MRKWLTVFVLLLLLLSNLSLVYGQESIVSSQEELLLQVEHYIDMYKEHLEGANREGDIGEIKWRPTLIREKAYNAIIDLRDKDIRESKLKKLDRIEEDIRRGNAPTQKQKIRSIALYTVVLGTLFNIMLIFLSIYKKEIYIGVYIILGILLCIEML